MGPARTPSFTGKRQLRGHGGGDAGTQQQRRAQADVEEAFYEAQTGMPFSDEWDFRRQRFVDPPQAEEEVSQEQQEPPQAQTAASWQSRGGILDADRGQGGYVVNPDAATAPAPEKAAALARMGPAGQDSDGFPSGGAGPAVDAPPPGPAATAPTGGPANATQPAAVAPSPNAPPAGAPRVEPAPREELAPPVDDYVGGTGEVTVVRFCSREVVCQVSRQNDLLRVVCAGFDTRAATSRPDTPIHTRPQECGPVNVVPRCTCSLVMYDPLTDPDYFLK